MHILTHIYTHTYECHTSNSYRQIFLHTLLSFGIMYTIIINYQTVKFYFLRFDTLKKQKNNLHAQAHIYIHTHMSVSHRILSSNLFSYFTFVQYHAWNDMQLSNRKNTFRSLFNLQKTEKTFTHTRTHTCIYTHESHTSNFIVKFVLILQFRFLSYIE